MKNLVIYFALAVTLLLSFTNTANSELLDRGGGLVYDDILDITWLQNANTPGGTMTWVEADDWAADLVFNGYNDWRLPLSDTSCSGYNCTDSEMGHLFYTEGVASDSSGLFTDVRPFMYWSGTDDSSDPSKAWRFNFKNDSGYQATSPKTYNRYAWAVRDGDSSVPVAPEPVSSSLFLIGGAALTTGRWWKNRGERWNK